MNTNRRKFLTSTGALTAGALAGNLGTWGVESANAQAVTRLQGHRLRVPVRGQRLEQHDRAVHGLRAVRRRAHGRVERRR